MPPRTLLPLAIAALLVGIGAQVALTAVLFFLATWARGAPGGAPVAGVVFAPFGLVALALPVAAAPLVMRQLPESSRGLNTGHVPHVFFSLWLGAELVTVAMRMLGGLPPLASPARLHVLICAYSAIGALLFCRRTRDET